MLAQVSDTGREAKFYRLTRKGRTYLEAEAASWERLTGAVAAILNDPEFKARFIQRAGHTGVGSTPSAFAKFVQQDLASKRELITAAGIVPE